MELAGADDDDPAPRLPYIAFYPVLLTLLWSGVRTRASSAAAGWIVIAAAILPLLAFFRGGGANSSYSDLPLACFYGAALLLLLGRRFDLSAGIAAGALLACAVLTKDEGTPLALAALAIACGWHGKTWRWRKTTGWARPLVAAVGVALLAWAFLVSWRSAIPSRYTDDYRAMLSQQSLAGAIERIPMLLSGIGREMFGARHWGWFWPVSPLVLLAGWRGLRSARAAAFALAFAAPLALAFAAYLITDLPGDLPRMTWNRFLMQGSVPFFTLFGWALGDLLRRSSLPRWAGGIGRRQVRLGTRAGA
jgi:hypothetical protein